MKQKQKKNKIQQSVSAAIPASVKPSFYKFIFNADNRKWFLAALGVSVLYFIILRWLFPIPSYFYDSYTYLQVARDHQPVSFRPIQYSEFINFFKGFSTSDFALIFAQYYTNVLANLLLFFTVTYFFSMKSVSKIVLFGLLFLNPLYIVYSNYILTDAFFASLTVLYFTLIIWILNRPAWYFIALQLLLLILLFKLRYHAIIFPFFLAFVILLTRQVLWQKLISIAVSFILLGMLVFKTINVTENYTGVRTFSAFSGWQMANNALHILRHETIDSTTIDDEEVKDVLRFVNHYFDTTQQHFDSTGVTAAYMWRKFSPLKDYVIPYAQKNYLTSYFQAWQTLGPVYDKFGKTIILKKPVAYIQHYVVPNTKAYVLPDMEAYASYNENADTISREAQLFYGYANNSVPAKRESFYSYTMHPWTYIFPVLNLLLLVLSVLFFAGKFYKKSDELFSKSLVSFWVLYLLNFFFIVFLAPSVFRYHVFIVTLSIPFILLLINEIFRKKEVLQ